MRTLVILSVIDIVLLIAGLAFYLYVVGGQLARIAGNLEECADVVHEIVGHGKAIRPGLESINGTGRVIAGALPLLYGMADGVVTGATYEPVSTPPGGHVNRPASGRRRSRLHDAVGYEPV